MGRAKRARGPTRTSPVRTGARGAPLAKPIVAAAGGRARGRGPGSAVPRGFFARGGVAATSKVR